MNIATFTEQIMRLSKRFGPKNFESNSSELFWDIVRDTPDFAFKQWVNNRLIEHRYAPMGVDFREFAKMCERNRLDEIAKEAANKLKNLPEANWKEFNYSCMKCRDDGLLLASHKNENIIPTAFVCDCPLGESSHWAEIKKTKDEPHFRIRRWKEQSQEIKDQFHVG